MQKDVQTAILVIAIVIPLSSFFVWNSDQTSISAKEDSSKITAVVSFSPLYDFTKEVGKDLVEVSSLVPQGVESHDWEPTINDLRKMQNSDLIIVNGLGFEGWLDDVKSSVTVQIIDASFGITTEISINDKGSKESPNDPHVWLDPIFVKKQVRNIVNGLVNLDPTNEKHFRHNEELYLEKLDALDEKIRNELSGCRKDFIVFHSAFSYFANRYGLNQHTILDSNDPHSEPTARKLTEVIKEAKRLDINIIFTEEGVDSRSSEILANEIGGKVLILSPLEIFDYNESYISKMENNLSNLKEALCS